MRSIKKSGKKSDFFFSKIGDVASYYLNKLYQFLRWEPRKRLMNRWARNHPKQFFGITTFAFSLILILSIFSGQPADSINQIDKSIKSLQRVDQPLNQFQAIQSVKEKHSKEMAQLIYDGGKIRKQLDSLIALPQKSHKDSLEIIRKHKQLKIIVNTLK